MIGIDGAMALTQCGQGELPCGSFCMRIDFSSASLIKSANTNTCGASCTATQNQCDLTQFGPSIETLGIKVGIKANAFQDLVLNGDIDLNGVGIINIQTNAFANAKIRGTVNLGGNEIERIHRDAFSNSVIDFLHINDQVTPAGRNMTIETNAFRGAKIVELDLSNAHLRTIQHFAFNSTKFFTWECDCEGNPESDDCCLQLGGYTGCDCAADQPESECCDFTASRILLHANEIATIGQEAFANLKVNEVLFWECIQLSAGEFPGEGELENFYYDENDNCTYGGQRKKGQTMDIGIKAFKNLHANYMDFTDSFIRNIQAYAFQQVTVHDGVDLWFNEIQTIGEGAFYEAHMWNYLDLSNMYDKGQTMTIKTKAFYMFTMGDEDNVGDDDDDIVISNAFVRIIESDAFHKVTVTDTIDFYANEIVTIGQNAFANAEVYFIGFANWDEIEDGPCGQYNKGQTMTIESNAFRDARIYDELELECSFVRTILPYAFNGTQLNYVLDLDMNVITSIESNAFFNARIDALYIDDNFEVDYGSPDNDQDMTRTMTVKTNAFRNTHIYDYMEIYDCNLMTIEPYAFNGSVIYDLEIYENPTFRTIGKNAFAGLEVTEYLGLYDNAITTLQQGAFSYHKASYIEISSQDLEDYQGITIETGAFDFVQLNMIEDYGDSVLDLSGCDGCCEQCGVTSRTLTPGAFRGLGELKYLELDQHGSIYHIHEATFNFMSKLESLDLSENGIQSIDWLAFLGLRKLNYLDLSNNALWCSPKVVDLVFQGNGLENLDLDLGEFEPTAFLPEAFNPPPPKCPLDASQYCYYEGEGTLKSDIIAQADECKETSTMQEIVSYGPTKGSAKEVFVGGLGKHTDADHATWGCFRGHTCLDQICGYVSDAMCFKYRQCDGHWTPWGEYSQLFLNNPASTCSIA